MMFFYKIINEDKKVIDHIAEETNKLYSNLLDSNNGGVTIGILNI